MLRRLRTIADFPLTPVILVLYFVLDLWILGTRHMLILTEASIFANRFTGPRRHVNWGGGSADFHRQSDGTFYLYYPLGSGPSGSAGILTVSQHGPWKGFWAPTHRTADYTIYDFQNLPLTADELNTVRDQFVSHLTPRVFPSDLTPTELQSLRNGLRVERVLFYPLGYLHNTLSLFMFAMLCWSLRLNIPKLWCRRTDPTKCPHCRYSTIGLTASTCPECGKPIT